MVRIRGAVRPFFLEWERRVVRPGTMAARLAPYLRYYSTDEPVDDHGAEPVVLIVFDDPLVEARFLGVARFEMARRRVKVPLWVSYREALEKVGPLGAAWRNPRHLGAHLRLCGGREEPPPVELNEGRVDRNRRAASGNCSRANVRGGRDGRKRLSTVRAHGKGLTNSWSAVSSPAVGDLPQR